MEPFYIIYKIPKINRSHWNLPWMSCILKFRSLKISLETLERSFHRGEKRQICREASRDIWNSPLYCKPKKTQILLFFTAVSREELDSVGNTRLLLIPKWSLFQWIFILWRVDYPLVENVLTEQMWFLPLISYWEVVTRILKQ